MIEISPPFAARAVPMVVSVVVMLRIGLTQKCSTSSSPQAPSLCCVAVLVVLSMSVLNRFLTNAGSRFIRFLVASYDRTGGTALGATVYIVSTCMHKVHKLRALILVLSRSGCRR